MVPIESRKRGFDVVLDTPDPLAFILSEGKPGDEDTIRGSLAAFKS